MQSSPEAVVRRCLDLAVPSAQPVLVAVSGGSDSVALLELVRRSGRPLAVAHVDHGLRPSAAADARLVVALCRDLDLPSRVLAAPPVGNDGRSETAARRRRLAALAGAARDLGCGWVLCAHHLDDALETLLLHLSRGHRGLRALAGVPSCRSLGGDLLLLRPLLYGPSVPGRAELARWREQAGLPHRDDPSNRDTAIPRNALRALLAGARPPLDRAGLAATRRRAVLELQGLVAEAATLLVSGFTAHGDGSLLRREVFPPEEGRPGAWAETLRLLGACLATPRRLRVRATLIDRVVRAVHSDHGQLLLPTDEGLLPARVTRDGLHLPGAAPAAADPDATVLSGLARTSLYL